MIARVIKCEIRNRMREEMKKSKGFYDYPLQKLLTKFLNLGIHFYNIIFIFL